MEIVSKNIEPLILSYRTIFEMLTNLRNLLIKLHQILLNKINLSKNDSSQNRFRHALFVEICQISVIYAVQ